MKNEPVLGSASSRGATALGSEELAGGIVPDPQVKSGEVKGTARIPEREVGSRRMAGATLAVFTVSLIALVSTIGDFGFTWDEPAYRYSQVMSAQWWEQLATGPFLERRAGADRSDGAALLLALCSLRHQFPPASGGTVEPGELRGLRPLDKRHSGAAHGHDDRVCALRSTIGFHFLARRYGSWVGAVMAGSLLLMPRLYGQAHLIDTDIAGLLLWAAAALAFWNGLYEPRARQWRVSVGILLGLAFVEKMAAVMVLVPLLLWLVVASPPNIGRTGRARGLD